MKLNEMENKINQNNKINLSKVNKKEIDVP